ncbi:zinc metalloprotease [Haloferax mucosum]|uniref:hypothetical protein n=1 Tax=Haloferax mucosum TaxID=403181 RepID=UPI0012671227|nr:hypothetical protein [Haloferax mucosum]
MLVVFDCIISRRKFLKQIGSTAVGLSLVTNVVAAEQSKSQESSRGSSQLSKNQIAYAKGELPNYLNNTIVDGSQKVTVTESAEVPEYLSEEDYDAIISFKEFDTIESRARDKFIEFGVDPKNPKATLVDGKPMHVDVARKHVKAGKVDLSAGHPVAVGGESFSTQSSGPKAINGEIHLHVVPASDSEHEPSASYKDATFDAWAIFGSEFGIEAKRSIHFGHWDASGVGTNTDDMLDDIAGDTDKFRDGDNHIVTGWVDKMDNNGIAGRYHSVNAIDPVYGVPWPHEQLVQHELSHNFEAPDRGTAGYEHKKCVMNYEYAARGIGYWCDVDHDIIENNIK